MKTAPFADYLARKQQADTRRAEPSAEAPVWPPRARPENAPVAPARQSPLLRQVEKTPRDSDGGETTRRLEQAHLKAFEEGRESARQELSEERSRFRAAVEAELTTARAAWAAEEGARLAEAHRAAIESFETRCAQAVADILRPFLAQEAIARVTGALVDTLETLLAGRPQSLFEISGPPDLLEALREKFSASGAHVALKPNESIDVRVRVEDTVIETQLEPWLKALGALPRDDRNVE